MKHLKTLHTLTAIVALCALCACGTDEYLGNDSDVANVERGQTISFNGGTSKSARASMLEGHDAAEKLNRQFTVFGTKTSGTTTQTVFDHYTVGYADNTALTTASNSADWEYVGQPLNIASSLPDGTEQTIKYWDLNADRYDFVAFSTGAVQQQKPTGTPGSADYPGTPAEGHVIVTPVDKDALTTAAYTISGAAADLAGCYIADRITSTKTAARREGISYPYRDAMKFNFRALGASMRLGLYETVTGYSVKDVRFYTDPSTSSAVPALFTGSQAIPCGKTEAIIKFPETDPSQTATYNRATVTYTAASEKTTAQTFGSVLAYGGPESQETPGNIYLGRTPSAASLSANATMLPAPLDVLNLKVDFTLVSIDYNETIDIKGASATVPAAFTQLQPNTNYTYLFKITDAVTDAFGQRLLYPVQFDALEITDDLGLQQTLTTIDQPSITTYAKGALNNGSYLIYDYYKGDRIYISVMNGSEKLLTMENSTLYHINITDSHTDPYEITEQNFFTHLEALYAGTFPNYKMEEITTDHLNFTNEIPAEDSPTGATVSANSGYNFAWFTANYGTHEKGEVYIFRYKNKDEILYTAEEINTAKAIVEADGYVDGTDPYAEELATKTAGTVKTPTEYHYKVIRVENIARP